ncbi:TPA: hypothetical protein ROY42_005657 [Bacillus thuringiensis]|nr:hypothetical protein [Bacillus thuringiensis]
MGFASHSYSKSVADINKHIDYIAYREREGEHEKYGLFNEHDDQANVKEFQKLMDDKKTEHPEVAVAHKILFSMSQDEWDRSGFQPDDYKTIIRNTLKQWELEKGYRLKWGASLHLNEGHPHCHVVIKATYEDRDGVHHRLKVNPQDRKFFKEQFDKEKTALRGFEMPNHRERMQEIKYPIGKSFSVDIMDQMFYEVQRKLEREQWEREMEQSR